MNHDRFRFRIWCKEINEYLVGTFLVGGEMIHNAVDFESFLDVGNFVIEQCTGLKDKNGNLIYEGDIVLLRNNKFEVGHNNITVFFKCLTDKYVHIDPTDFDYDDSEIIGNIHETKGG